MIIIIIIIIVIITIIITRAYCHLLHGLLISTCNTHMRILISEL
jgi:hypothetical protein